MNSETYDLMATSVAFCLKTFRCMSSFSSLYYNRCRFFMQAVCWGDRR